MAHKNPPRVKEQALAHSGTGAAYVLDGVTNASFDAFADRLADGDTCDVLITDNAGNYETGVGTFASGANTITLSATGRRSSNGDAAVAWTGEDLTVAVVHPGMEADLPWQQVMTKNINGHGNFGSRNLAVNGACLVGSRGSQASIGASNGYIVTAVDQQFVRVLGSPQARVTSTQDTSVTWPGGFSTSHKLDCTTAEAAVAAGELVAWVTPIEARRARHLKWGQATAKKVTVSFEIQSPKSGTHCAFLYQPDGARSQVKEFTVTAADTPERCSVTFTGDTGGTVNNDGGEGLRFGIALVAGTDFQVAAGAWAAGEDCATSNQQNLLDNTANNFFVTGVQVEVGSVATEYEHLDKGAEEHRCQRYFRRQSWPATGNAGALAAARATDRAVHEDIFPVEMASAPTVTVNNATNFGFDGATTGSIAMDSANGSTTSVQRAVHDWAITGGTVEPGRLRILDTNATIDYSAEIIGT